MIKETKPADSDVAHRVGWGVKNRVAPQAARQNNRAAREFKQKG
jgi:hypothetical protein